MAASDHRHHYRRKTFNCSNEPINYRCYIYNASQQILLLLYLLELVASRNVKHIRLMFLNVSQNLQESTCARDS